MPRSILVSEDIVALGDFKAHASRILRRLHEHQRSVVITQHGKPSAVVITPQEFDRLQEFARFTSAVREGLADGQAGRLIEDEDLAAILDAEFGPLE